jgi:hypothetical protein
MDNTWLTVFTAIVAVALLIQSLAFFGLYRAVRDISGRVDGISRDLTKNIGAVADKTVEALAAIKATAAGVREMGQKLSVTVDVVQKRIGAVDLFLRDMTDTARLEVARIQDVAETAARHLEDTFNVLHKGVLAPASEISAAFHGFKVGLNVLLGKSRGRSARAPNDEEMFIG